MKNNLHLIERHQALAVLVFAGVFTGGLIAAPASAPVYRASAKLLVPDTAWPASPAVMNPPEVPKTFTVCPTYPDVVGPQLQMLRSPNLESEARRLAGIEGAPGEPALKVFVDCVEGTNILQITVESGDPEAASRLANTMAQRHIENMTQLTGERIEEARDWVEEEWRQCAHKLRSTEQRLLQSSRVHASKPTQQRLLSERDALEAAYEKLTVQLQDLELRVRAHPLGARIIEPAVTPTRRVRSHSAAAVVLWALLALVAATGTAWVKECVDGSRKQREDRPWPLL